MENKIKRLRLPTPMLLELMTKRCEIEPIIPTEGELEEMTYLAQSFPCLYDAPGVEPFDAARLIRWAAGLVSHRQHVTVRFLIAVLNKQYGELSPFDPVEAIRVWEPEDREAVEKWADNVWWPSLSRWA